MSRKRKFGNNTCLKCGNAGRYISKWTRNGELKNSTGNVYSYFRHNDPKLKECYVDNILKNKAKESCKTPSSQYLFAVVNDLYSYLTRMGKAYFVIQNKFKTYPLKSNEKRFVEMGLAWYKSRYVNPVICCLDIVSSALLYETSESPGIKKADFYNSIKTPLKKNLEKLRQMQNDFKQDPEIGALLDLFCEYEIPIWLEKRKGILDKQSEAAFGSEKYRSVYTGIESVD